MGHYRRIILFNILALLAWCCCIYVLYTKAIKDDVRSMRFAALTEARIAYDKDITYRRWAAKLGGVYAEISESLHPNEHLDVPGRDITTPDGKRLTLVNPAYMTRMVHEIAQEAAGLKGHITSLDPIRAANAPTAWEAQALRSFQEGVPEFIAFDDEDGRPVLRFMRPMITEKPCLKCHARQGYKEGDIRGGISVTMPLDQYAPALADAESGTRTRYTLILLSGVVLIAFSTGVLWLNERLRDKTMRIAMESDRRIRESEERYRMYVQHAPLAIFIADGQGRLVDVNPMTCEVTGHSRAELLRLTLLDLLPGNARRVGRLHMENVAAKGATVGVLPYLTREGAVRWWEVSAVKLSDDRVLGFANDISDRKRAEDTLSASLHEKEVLLREIHHRVKNNLQIVCSLLSLQGQGVDNQDALRVLGDCQCRVMSMALVHEQLYRSGDLSGINVRHYVETLLSRLLASCRTESTITLSVDIPPMNLSLDQAIPFGLVLNELVTNSLKHAFTGRASGHIEVRGVQEDGEMAFTIRDDGLGLPHGFKVELATSLGLQIVSTLVGQLRGNMEMRSNGGTEFVFHIPGPAA
ncbi:putative sensor histidine kinase pdtaS [Fundidesulfovibrio magnetotacticus]|uniref:Putative sensor histidine kinase pdtaS n=1 Tax=Fundidesulfovibrio magnetotacticus TaxID=2730080 RepID=A0A6V8M1N6_9BACT|nr:histidine kinase dimerization/phosphoacceptor domain -containing protein [Fundidesulfovibrio magnetotacticus]GFK95856.1 putative sensor histidine kinase pdtaS [Fundidesulfovibrio magnetotacticus]